MTDERATDAVGTRSTHDVAIVGAGPVGTALAILLAQHGRRVVVLERWPSAYPLPRAVHYDHEVGRILQACGLGDDLAAISEPAEIYEWRNAAGATLLRFGRVGLGGSGWPQSSMFNQPELEALLERRARSLPGIDLRRGVEVTGLRQDDNGVVLDALDHQNGAAPVTVRADYAVGCDGANSTIRTLLDVPVQDLGFFHEWLIVDVVLDEPRVFDPVNVQICDPTRPSTAVSGGPGRRRWEFMRLPHEQLADLDSEEAAWRLLADWDVTATNATLERHAVYTFQARQVEQWRQGRVLLAGDAAHQMPPFAGQGLCAGLRDVATLAWKLDLVLGGGARASLLDSYQAERSDNVRAVIDFSIALGKVICVSDPAEAAARDAAMTAGVVGDDVTDVPPMPGNTVGLRHPDAPHAGEVFIQGPVGPDRTRFDDAAGAGWRLVTTPAVASELGVLQADLGDLSTWFAGIGGKVIGVGPGGDLTDPDNAYGNWFARHGATAALQRPDFHLYGTAADADATISLLRHLQRSLIGAADGHA